jgi:hypothetical protein
MIFAIIPGVSPISPITSIIPVVFIFGTTYIKDGLEDIVKKNYFSPLASLFVG